MKLYSLVWSDYQNYHYEKWWCRMRTLFKGENFPRFLLNSHNGDKICTKIHQLLKTDPGTLRSKQQSLTMESDGPSPELRMSWVKEILSPFCIIRMIFKFLLWDFDSACLLGFVDRRKHLPGYVGGRLVVNWPHGTLNALWKLLQKTWLKKIFLNSCPTWLLICL